MSDGILHCPVDFKLGVWLQYARWKRVSAWDTKIVWICCLGNGQYINWESRPRKGGHKGCATSVVFNMVHWYIKPECIYPVTSHPPGNWKNWADILWAGENIVTHKPGTCLPLPAFSAVWFMHRCVSIPIMYERSRKSDASFCCWFQWDLGSVKSCCRYI